MKPQEIQNADVPDIDWRTIIPRLGIQPLNDVEAADWIGDVAALKMGEEFFLSRMAKWDDPYRGKSAQPTYMIENNQPNNFEGLTPNGDVSYKVRSPLWNGQPFKFPKSFKNDEERMSFVKYVHMVHLYRNMVDTKHVYKSSKATHRAHIIMTLVVALLRQRGLNVNRYTIGNDTMLSEAMGFAGLNLDGQALSGWEEADFINNVVTELSTNGKVSSKRRDDVPLSKGWQSEKKHEDSITQKLAGMTQQQKDELLMKLMKNEQRKM